MTKTFHLTIAKVGENLFEGEALSVSLPGSEGVFQVLAGHEAYISELNKGMVKIIDADGALHEFSIARGVAEVSHNQATVLL
jgi:F-type H+-transporting ATPase subunit epsilon